MPITEFNKILGYHVNSYIGLWSETKLDIPAGELAGAKTMSEIADSVNEMAVIRQIFIS